MKLALDPIGFPATLKSTELYQPFVASAALFRLSRTQLTPNPEIKVGWLNSGISSGAIFKELAITITCRKKYRNSSEVCRETESTNCTAPSYRSELNVLMSCDLSAYVVSCTLKCGFAKKCGAV